MLPARAAPRVAAMAARPVQRTQKRGIIDWMTNYPDHVRKSLVFDGGVVVHACVVSLKVMDSYPDHTRPRNPCKPRWSRREFLPESTDPHVRILLFRLLITRQSKTRAALCKELTILLG
uniref:Uncharacterized protein n=1 Tax=Grammatophora oceanica TaxID=210454 RepID=A0A7S1UU43_9STRA